MLLIRVLYGTFCHLGFSIQELIQQDALFAVRPLYTMNVYISSANPRHRKKILSYKIACERQFRRGSLKNCHLDLEDLQEIDILQKRKNLGKGELASIAFAKKTKQAFLTDDIKARRLAEEVMTRQFVQTTPHLLGWLFFAYFLGDYDLKTVTEEHKKYSRPLAQYFKEMYNRALDYRSKQYLS